MSLSVTTNVDDIVLAKGKVALGLSSNNYIATAGVAETGYIHLTADPVNDDTLTIIWGDTELNFVFKTTPDDSGLQLPLNGSANRNAYARDELLPALKQNRILYTAFDLEHHDGTTTTARVNLTSKTTGSISLDITSSVAGTPSATAGTTEVVQENFAVVLDIFKEQTFDDLDYALHASLEIKVDESGDVTVDLSPYLKSLFDGLHLPSQSMSTITRAMELANRLHIRFAEKYGQTPVVKDFDPYAKATETAPIVVINGGYRSKEHPNRTFVADYYTESAARKFLTKNPDREQEVADDTIVFLAFFNKDGSTSLELDVALYYTDGTSADRATATLDISGYTSLDKDIYLVPCGINMLSLNSIDSAKTIDYYEVVVSDNTTDRTEAFTFRRNGDYNRHSTQFLFENSLGMPETLWCRGDLSKGADFSKETYRKPLAEVYDETDTENATFNHRFADKWSVNTGYFGKSYLQYIERELLMSEHVYLIEDDTYYKVIINKNSIKLKPEDDGYGSLDFEYQETFENESA